MLNKQCKEWNIEALWGTLAMVSWGDPANQPVFMVHGYIDSAATFIPLLEHLPDNYYYVAVDLPGNGKSDPFPPGPIVMHSHIIEVIRTVVEHMKWDTFICLTHSAGFLYGIYYNAVFPNRISKMINIDPTPTMHIFYFIANIPEVYTSYTIDNYYGNYEKYYGPQKLYKYDEAVAAVCKAREIPSKEAEIILSRCMVPAGDGFYSLSWEPRMKKISHIFLSEDSLFKIVTTNAPPILCIFTSNKNNNKKSKLNLRNMYAPNLYRKFGANMFRRFKETIPNYSVKYAEGGHDVHITNPKTVARYVEEFLSKDFRRFKSKI